MHILLRYTFLRFSIVSLYYKYGGYYSIHLVIGDSFELISQFLL